MTTSRFGRAWADVDEDDEDECVIAQTASNARFETPVDEHGNKTVIEYAEREGRTYKVSRKVKQRTVAHWTNTGIAERKHMKKFGKPAEADSASEKMLVVRSEEDVIIELSKKLVSQVAKDDAEDKFHDESLLAIESVAKVKKAWTELNQERQAERDVAKPEEKPAETPAAAGGKGVGAAAGGAAAAGTKYVPPSLRVGAGTGKGDGKGPGKGGPDQEASLRITNLSEDCREGDLQELFGDVGRLQRVYLAKDQVTMQSRGFAFVTYYTREDAQRAIKKLHGHGYDNLILQVQWAKPRA